VEACKAIAKALKAFVPIRNGDKGVVQVKQLVGSQSFLGLIGYITKLPLQVRLWNISPSMVKEGQQLYALVKVDPLAGKRAVNKSNIMKELYAFWHRNLRPTWFAAEAVTLYMIQSGEYMPTSVWLMGGSGQGLDFNKVTVFWKLVHQPEDATMRDIMTIFYARPTLAQNRLASGPLSFIAHDACFRYHHVNTGLEPTPDNIEAPVPYSQAVQAAEAARADEYAYHFDGEIGASGEANANLHEFGNMTANASSPIDQVHGEAGRTLSFFWCLYFA